MLPLILLALGSAMLLVGAFGGKGNAGKSRRRRLDAVKFRHAPGNPIETQLRKVAALRGSRLDDRVTRMLSNPDMLRRRIEAAGKSWTLGRYAMGCAGLGCATMMLLLIQRMPFLLSLFMGLLVGLGFPHFWLGWLAKRRLRKFLARFPDAIELLVRGLRSGLPITETMQIVGGEIADPVGGEFRNVSDRMRIGHTMDAALQETADRLATPEFQFFVITLAIQRETGGNLAETLGNLADVLRKRLQMKLKIKAMSSEAKASAYIIGALPFSVFLIVYLTNPEYMIKFFTDTRLMIAGIGGLIWMAIGVFVMSKMINFEI